MGANQSVSTHEELFDLTADTRNVMNAILQYMMKELSLRDFSVLSNSTECNKYVIFKANALYNYFYDAQIMPTRDKKGVISFRPLKELIASKSKDKEQQSLCLILAYYYTRIFQIYGALALTLIDDADMVTRSGLMEKRLYAPGDVRHVYTEDKKYEKYDKYDKHDREPNSRDYRSYRQYGGKPFENLQNFEYLTPFLTEEYKEAFGYKSIYNDQNTIIYFKENIQSRYGYGYPSSKGTGFFTIYPPDLGTITIYVTNKDETPTKSELKFDRVEYKNKRGSTVPIQITIVGKTKYVNPDKKTVSSEKSGTFTDVGVYFNKQCKKIIEELEYKINNIESTSSTSTSTSIKELELKSTITTIRKTKPYGHCIARALQLLQTIPNKDIASICGNTSFLDKSSPDGSKKFKSIPKPNGNLESSPGLSALALLFYDTIQNGAIKIGIDNKYGGSTFDKYIEFMKNMSKLFTGATSATSTTSDTFPSGLKGISNRRDAALCDRIKTISPSSESEIMIYVKKLFSIQYAHANNCGNIFNQLFKIQKNKSGITIALNDNILKNGIPEIERINNMARTILVEYYSNCETSYLHGIQAIINGNNNGK